MLEALAQEKVYSLEVDMARLDDVRVKVRGSIDIAAVGIGFLEEMLAIAQLLIVRCEGRPGAVRLRVDCREAFLDTYGLRHLKEACLFYQNSGFRVELLTCPRTTAIISRLFLRLALMIPLSSERGLVPSSN